VTLAAAGDDFERAAQALRLDLSQRPRLREAAAMLESGQLGPATRFLQEFLKTRPNDVNALYLFAEAATRQGGEKDAELLLARCLKLAPNFTAARFEYVNALLRVNNPKRALSEVETLLKQEPRNPLFRMLQAHVRESVEDYAASAATWRALCTDYPNRSDCWVRYGHALRSMGSRDESIAAYRHAIKIDPSTGGAWWSLADLKTFRFDEAEIECMEGQLPRADLSTDDRTRLHFALGKAFADRKFYEQSFGHYVKGNALHRLGFNHDPDLLTAYVARCKALFTTEFFRARAGSGDDSAEPIFVVGLPRSGSTLVEQILASHSQIEGTKELSDLAAIPGYIRTDIAPNNGAGYPGILETLDAETLKTLGQRYLHTTRAHRKLGRPFFVDKMGPNFVHIGLLQLILPNAKIVDVRRHPLACGFSIFAQLFPKGQNDAYRLTDIGHHYRCYVELMAHFDSVLPGKVHRVLYEDLVANPETKVRRLLDYLNLPFEPTCLEFYKTNRAVTTVSSEQVRSPIYRDALEQWRHYEPWLGPLIEILGPVLTDYPAVPEALG
jgi:tetratricopeptide (TPR) repeat protein